MFKRFLYVLFTAFCLVGLVFIASRQGASKRNMAITPTLAKVPRTTQGNLPKVAISKYKLISKVLSKMQKEVTWHK